MWWLLAACDGGKDTGPGTDDPTVTHTGGETTESTPPTTDTGTPPTTHTGTPPPACPPFSGQPQLATSTGCVLGATTSSGTEEFLGIPFAEPPLGALRFAPPVPVAPWVDPLEATLVGPACVQFSDSIAGDLVVGDGEEDCLRLNVLRPVGAADLPILFFVHGGGHLGGSGGEGLYVDDPGLASDAVIVTVNYRLGALGYLAHPLLSAEDPEGVSGNYGMRDVLTALQWVNDNAVALGGDPDQLLVFGESAGALETCAMLASPRAAGLFDAAIAQSGPCQFVGKPLRDAPPLVLDGETQGLDFAADLACSDVACLRAVPVETLVEVGQSDVAAGPTAQSWSWNPWLDGVWLPEDVVGAFRAGQWNQVPFLATVNADEGTIFTLGVAPTQDALDTWLDLYSLLLGVPRRDLAAQYDPADHGGTDGAFAALWGDVSFVCPTIWQQEALAAQGPAYGGYWTESVPVLGAFHGSELRYVFGTGPFFGQGVDTTDRLQGAWTSMATGAPTVTDLGAWPEVGDGWVELREGPSRVVGPPHAAECVLFEGSPIDLWH